MVFFETCCEDEAPMVSPGGSRSGIIWLFGDKRLFPAISRVCHAVVQAICRTMNYFLLRNISLR